MFLFYLVFSYVFECLTKNLVGCLESLLRQHRFQKITSTYGGDDSPYKNAVDILVKVSANMFFGGF